MIIDISTTLSEFEYDGDGMRITKTSNGKTVVYHYDKEGRIISETDIMGNLIADYIYLNGKLVAKVEHASLYFHHTDPAGTPMAMTDSTKNVVWKADYRPFGEEQSITGTIENNEKFVGKEKDKETGLYYFGARYMEPRIGRFIAVDPVGPVSSQTGKVNEKLLLNPQRLNRYSYSINNPYRYVDPDGRWPEEVHNSIIKAAFPKLPRSAIIAMQRGSARLDEYQAVASSYKHAMRAPNQTPQEAERLMNDFIRQKVADYKRLMADGQEVKAYEALGMAMHPLMDATSPSHEGFQEWAGRFPVIDGTTKKALEHKKQERDISQERFNLTVDKLRNFYWEINR